MKEIASIKSARRVFEVLQHFSEFRQPATVTQVSKALGYPQSSTSVLLASLESLGYLAYDRHARTYLPTLRVMLLGSWMHDDLFGEGSLVSAMDRLRRRTGQTVLIGLRQDIHVRFILSLQGTHAQALRFSVGVLRPVCRSVAGQVLLSQESDAEIARIVRRANAEAISPDDRIEPSELTERIRRVRRLGWAETLDYPIPGRGAIAVALPRLQGQPLMALVLGARKARLEGEREKLVSAMREVVPGLSRADQDPVGMAHASDRS